MTERRFPVLVIGRLTVADLQREAVSAIVLSIPWALIAPHAARVEADWGHSLEFLAEDRGGLMAHELVAIIEGREVRLMPRAESNARLLELMAVHQVIHVLPATRTLAPDEIETLRAYWRSAGQVVSGGAK